MTGHIEEIANKFLNGGHCSREELALFKRWLSDPFAQHEVETWLAGHWAHSDEVDSHLLLEKLIHQIESLHEKDHPKFRFSVTRFARIYQKVAAFMLIPLIIAGILYWLSPFLSDSGQYTETFAPRGQKSQIILSDGTKVWLNSETKIRYPGSFDKGQRDVYLTGEAFFEVSRNKLRPFVVHTPDLKIKVLGTKFNIKAYPDEKEIATSLFEGKVSLVWHDAASSGPVEKEMEPRQSFVFDKSTHQLAPGRFSNEEIDGWKKNQLIFKDDTFSKLVRKVERWYDVEIIYDEKEFDDRQLTVELYEGERLDRLMQVISLTLSVDYQYENGKIILTPKKTGAM
ncbi:MAG: FecR domain-containing protein [Prolixibacteraceae bacterium]